MEPANEVVSQAEIEMAGQYFRTNFCLANKGQLYMIFSMHYGVVQIDMPPGGSYVVTQLDPRTGTQLDLDIVTAGKQSIACSGREQVLLLERQDD